MTTLDFAKAMIDEGYHPMTMYFPLVVHGAMLIEPTETESKSDTGSLYADVMEALAEAAKAGETERFQAAPIHAHRPSVWMKPARLASRSCAGRHRSQNWKPLNSRFSALN